MASVQGGGAGGQASRTDPVGWAARTRLGNVHTSLHDFVKSALLQQLVPPGATVCDILCGNGADTAKWAQAQIGRYVGVDVTASALEEAREQWDHHGRPYPADFCELDPGMDDLQTQLRHMGLPADIVCCMGHLQCCFWSELVGRKLLQNVASILKPGGYFFGTTADSSTIWIKYQKAVEGAHKAGFLRANGALPVVHSERYTISFEDDRFTPFGTKYKMHFSDGQDEPQILVHFPSLISIFRLAEEVGLEYIELQNLYEFYEDYRIPFAEALRRNCGSLLDSKGRLLPFTHDILSLYTTFIFKKADHNEPGYTLSIPHLLDEHLELSNEDTVLGAGTMDVNNAPIEDHHCSPPEAGEPPSKRQKGSLVQVGGAETSDTWMSEEYHASAQIESTMRSPVMSNMDAEVTNPSVTP